MKIFCNPAPYNKFSAKAGVRTSKNYLRESIVLLEKMMETQEYQFVKEIIPTEIEENSILNIVTRDVNTHTHGFINI